MAAKKEVEKIIYWYKLYKEWEQSGISMATFCKKNNINLVKFGKFKQSYIGSPRSNEDNFYEKLKAHNQAYDESGISMDRYCKAADIKVHELIWIRNHLRICEITKEYEANPEKYASVTIKSENLGFVKIKKQLPKKQAQPEIVHEPIVVQPRKPIELISDGIQITIQQEVKTEKIIKIIELLKDL